MSLLILLRINTMVLSETSYLEIIHPSKDLPAPVCVLDVACLSSLSSNLRPSISAFKSI